MSAGSQAAPQLDLFGAVSLTDYNSLKNEIAEMEIKIKKLIELSDEYLHAIDELATKADWYDEKYQNEYDGVNKI